MSFWIVRNDITRMRADAIVNAANTTLLGGGGVDGAIHRAAGPELLEECRTLGGCPVGMSRITRGYRMDCKYIIHTVGPIWQGGFRGEPEQLAACYQSALELAERYECRSVAFPLISSGVFGYPKDKAIRVATETITAFLASREMDVTLVIYSVSASELGDQSYGDITQYIERVFSDPYKALPRMRKMPGGKARLTGAIDRAMPLRDASTQYDEQAEDASGSFTRAERACAPSASLDDLVEHLDDGFSQMLLRLIDERGMSDAECYKRANIDRKLFSKIRSNPRYKPSKPTALAFAIALRLTLAQTNDLLLRAGFAISHASKFDIIVEYYIIQGVYDVHRINLSLFEFDQPLLGMY